MTDADGDVTEVDTESSSEVIRLSSQASVLWAWAGVPQRLTAVRERYRAVWPEAVLTAWSGSGGGVACLTSTPLADSGDGPLLAWGLPYLLNRRVEDEDLRAAFADPSRVGLRGRYLLARLVDGMPRLVVGPDVTHALVTCAGVGGRTWATRGLAALDAAGVAPRIAVERVPELVFFDYVLQAQELLAGVEPVEEATVVDASVVRSWWPVDQRLAVRVSTPAMLREALRASSSAVCRDQPTHLALTAGRDSTLLASCLAAGPAPAAALTFGARRSPDMAGAAATARALGWPHRHVPSGDPAPDLLARLLTRSVWTEGLDNAWNLVGPDFAWPVAPGSVLLTGSGGEAGRAFYWGTAAPWTDPVALLSDWVGGTLAEGPQAALRERVTGALAELAPLADGHDRRLLDLLYVRGRLRGWLDRQWPQPQFHGFVAAFHDPDVLACLLGLPEQDRRTGRGFDQALADCPHDLSGVVRAALAPRLPAVTAGRPAALVRRAGRRLHPPEQGLTVIDALHAALGSDYRLSSQALGPQWWAQTRHEATGSGLHRRWLWNALAVDGFARSLDRPGTP